MDSGDVCMFVFSNVYMFPSLVSELYGPSVPPVDPGKVYIFVFPKVCMFSGLSSKPYSPPVDIHV